MVPEGGNGRNGRDVIVVGDHMFFTEDGRGLTILQATEFSQVVTRKFDILEITYTKKLVKIG